MEDLDTELLGQLQRWHEEDQYQRIIDAIEAIPQPERGYELTCQLARAYNNLAGPEEAGPLEKSVSLLESIADQGQEDPLWHYRLGYALFYLDREEEALPHFQRAAELAPQDPDAPEFIRQCQKYIAAKQCCPEVYGQEDWDTVDQHIHTYFGSSENVFHEIVSPNIHVDIYIIPPSPERNYYILMTHGMGAHAMNVPEDLAGQKLERAELFICLPPDWKVGEEGEAWYWPIRWLKILARLPINEDSWLGWGHTIANPDGSPFAENTRFNGIMLVNPGAFPQEASVCPLSGGDEVISISSSLCIRRRWTSSSPTVPESCWTSFPRRTWRRWTWTAPASSPTAPRRSSPSPSGSSGTSMTGRAPRAASPLTASWWTAAGWATATGRSRRRGTRIGIAAGASPPEMRATAIWTTPAAAASITSTPCATTTRTSSLCWTPNQAPPGAGTRAECSVRSCISLTKNERL